VFFAFLMLPGSLILLLVALLVISTVSGWRSRESKVDPAFAGRFRDLENSILDREGH
jgi:hypothetical protein